MTIKIPITIFSDIKSEKLFKNTFIRKITNDEVRNLFGMASRSLDKKLQLTQISPIQCNKPTEEGLFPFKDPVSHILSNYLLIFSSNYIIESNFSDKEEIISKIQLAFKLGDLTKTGVSLYFDDQRKTYFVHPNPFCKIENRFFTLYKKDLINFRKLLNLVIPKENLIIEKYLSSTSGEKISLANRFLETAIILEMFLLPKKNTELNYRFALRGSKLLNIFIGQDKREGFTLMKNIYDIRCDLAHGGNSRKLNEEYLIKSQKITSLFMKKYLEDSTIFSDDRLEELCID